MLNEQLPCMILFNHIDQPGLSWRTRGHRENIFFFDGVELMTQSHQRWVWIIRNLPPYPLGLCGEPGFEC